jgi:hypothetical protein
MFVRGRPPTRILESWPAPAVSCVILKPCNSVRHRVNNDRMFSSNKPAFHSEHPALRTCLQPAASLPTRNRRANPVEPIAVLECLRATVCGLLALTVFLEPAAARERPAVCPCLVGNEGQLSECLFVEAHRPESWKVGLPWQFLVPGPSEIPGR